MFPGQGSQMVKRNLEEAKFFCQTRQASEGSMRNQGQSIREVEISQHTMLVKVLQEINGPVPKLIYQERNEGLKKVCVSIDTNKIPIKLGWNCGERTFESDWVLKYETAERQACIKAFDYLVPKYDIDVQDLSYKNIQNIKATATEVHSSINALEQAICLVFEDWQSCFQSLNSMRDSLDPSSTSVESFDARLIEVSSNAKFSVGFLSEKLSELVAEQMPVFERYNAKKNNLENSVPAKISEKDLLDCMLLGLNKVKAEYTHTALNNEKYKSDCEFDLSGEYGFENCGKTKVQGEERATPWEAECSAAEAGIMFLQRKLSLQIIDHNYEKYLVEQEDLNSLKYSLRKMQSLATSVLVAWNKMIMNLNKVADVQEELCLPMGLDTDSEVELNHKLDCSSQMNKLLVEIRARYEEAAGILTPHLN